MRINHNISAINTNRLLATNNSSTSKNLEKLSSGLSVNRAGDNAAGLAISEKMRGQIRGLNQATDNANDGISLIQTAEGGLNETHAILQRMRELAVQSANDTNTDSDRKEIQKEVDQLTTEITRISTDTEFNTKKLLDGSMAISSTTSNANFTASIPAGGDTASGTYTVNVTCTDGSAAVVGRTATQKSAEISSTDQLSANISGIKLDDIATYITAKGGTFPASSAGDVENTLKLTFTKSATGYDVSFGDSDTSISTGQGAAAITTDYGISFGAAGNTGDKTVITLKGGLSARTAADAVLGTAKVDSITDADGNTVSKNALNIDLTAAGKANSSLSGITSFTVSVDSSKALTFHIGANSGQNTKLTVQDMSASAIGVDAVDLTSQSGADAAITTIDTAINTVSAQRAALGAMQNRLEHTINNLGTSSENLSAAESQIRDVDMAEEMSEYTKNNILVQAATSMLAQANQQPQSVLSLLG